MSKAPIRGTQSFVGTMGEVWRRPGLTGIEVLTRWIAWAPVLLVALPITLRSLGMDVHLSAAGAGVWWIELQQQALMLTHGARLISFSLSEFFIGVLPFLGFAALWGAISGIGRSFLLRRVERALKPRILTFSLFAALRVTLFTTLLVLWLAALMKGWIGFVQGPQARGEYPGYVTGFALLLTLTVTMFVLWCSFSWMLRLAPMLAMAHGLGPLAALRAAWKTGPLRAKLVEINLVMGVVKVGLIVWSMALSSCPLPFANNETQQFLNWWWFGTFLLWVLASDYFHVVREAAYLRLAQAYDFVPRDTARGAPSAS